MDRFSDNSHKGSNRVPWWSTFSKSSFQNQTFPDTIHRPALSDGGAYLSGGLQAAGKLDLVDAMVHWLAVGGALGHGALAATTAHTDAVDNVTCREEVKKKKKGEPS